MPEPGCWNVLATSRFDCAVRGQPDKKIKISVRILRTPLALVYEVGPAPTGAAAVNEQTIFTEALERTDPQDREAFLVQACQGDSDLRRRIDRLLARHQHTGGFLEKPAVATATIDLPPTEAPGTVIGPYKLLEQIGEGGMGTVWMAQQSEPVRRLVAIKLIKAGMDSRHVIARFEAERQALALMDHPN